MEDRFEVVYKKVMSQQETLEFDMSSIRVIRDKENGVEYLYITRSGVMGNPTISITPLLNANGMPSVKY